MPIKSLLLGKEIFRLNGGKVEVTQECTILCDPMDCNPPFSSVMEFSKQEYWSELLFPYLGDLPNPGIEPGSPALQSDSLPSETPRKPKWRKGKEDNKGKTKVRLMSQLSCPIVFMSD